MKEKLRKLLNKLKFTHKLGFLHKLKFIKRMDRYIITKFIGTYFYSIALIISISIVFDINENLAKFTSYHAPLRAIVFDYYANFVPYFANLFSPLFVFIAVIFFTSKLAGNSEIIAMLASGMSFKRLLRPYMISAALISALNFYLGSYVIPKGTVVRHDFESLYKNNKKITSAQNVQLQVGKGVIAYISQYDDKTKTGYGFSLDKFEKKKLILHTTANVVKYDTISDSRYHVNNLINDSRPAWHAREDYLGNGKGHCDNDGAYGSRVQQGSARDVHQSRTASLYLQTARTWLKQRGAV